MLSILKTLSESFGPSGCEDDVRDFIVQQLTPHWSSAEVDAMGNLIVSTGEQLDGPVVMIAAHMDEVGFIIDYIDDQGYLRFKKVGGIDDRILPSTRVRVGKNRVPGVIGMKPWHLTKGDEKNRVTRSDDLYIDIGATSKAEALQVVTLGDYATFDTPFQSLESGMVTGKALDDRAGCAIAMMLAKKGVPLPTKYAFTVQEEIGLRGAKTAAYRINPDVAIVLETTTCADMPDPDARHRSTRLGEGPVLTFQDATSIPHPGLLQMLVDVASQKGTPFQWKQTTAGGNDAGSIHLARGGIPTVSVSLPCRYLHAPSSMLSTTDMTHTLELVEAFLQAIAKEGVPAR